MSNQTWVTVMTSLSHTKTLYLDSRESSRRSLARACQRGDLTQVRLHLDLYAYWQGRLAELGAAHTEINESQFPI